MDGTYQNHWSTSQGRREVCSHPLRVSFVDLHFLQGRDDAIKVNQQDSDYAHRRRVWPPRQAKGGVQAVTSCGRDEEEDLQTVVRAHSDGRESAKWVGSQGKIRALRLSSRCQTTFVRGQLVDSQS